jgi:hypothetical protein
VAAVLPSASTAVIVRLSPAPAVGVALAAESVKLVADPELTVTCVEVAAVTDVSVVSDAEIVYAPAVFICRPLKLATPFVAATDVDPAPKVPEEGVTFTVSVEPVFPVVMVLP